MTLEDFERELERGKEEDKQQDKHRDHRGSGHRYRQHHHHHSSRHRDSHYDDNEHRTKRSRPSRDKDEKEEDRRRRRKQATDEGRNPEAEDGAEEVTSAATPSSEGLKRMSWMEAPSALDIDYVQPKKRPPSPPKQGSLEADFELKLHKNELNHHLKDLKTSEAKEDGLEKPSEHGIDYDFGDAGSGWRMTRLNAVLRQAKESGRKVEDVALERYASLRDFDDAREEEIELERRETYGEGYVGKIKPSGELYAERNIDAGIRRTAAPIETEGDGLDDELDQMLDQVPIPAPTSQKIDQTELNKMKAALMKAQLKKAPNAAELEKEYNAALARSQQQDPTIVTLSAMDNRMLSSAPRNEFKSVQNRRGAERGQVEENNDMSIEDMVREERRTRHQTGGDGQRFAERIAKDAKFDNDLEYMDENASKLAKRVHKSDANLRNVAISEYQKMEKILENCPLCYREDTEPPTPPVAPVVSLGTRTFLTLPTEPELASFSAMIVPIQHRTNLLECDDDEWEEMRNFMKSVTRLYHDQGRDVVFYENAAHPQRKPHAALTAIPLPYSLGETAPAFFQEAFLTTEDEWSQHKKIIDTLAKSKQGLGRSAFRRSLVKEMPYFHVWFELDGGIGHVVEDPDRWPKGDLFAREVIGGMLGSEPDVIKRQGRWHKGHDGRVEGFRKKWRKFDWTRVLTEGSN